MGSLTQVTIDFETSHLVFPILIGCILAVLGLAILITKRERIGQTGTYWQQTLDNMDKVRFFGTLALTVLYFSLMLPVSTIWPNTGLGFLICSIPYVLATGLLFMHERRVGQVLVMLAVALIGPTFVWWLFTEIFFLTLP